MVLQCCVLVSRDGCGVTMVNGLNRERERGQKTDFHNEN